MSASAATLVIAFVWLGCAFGSGALLAWFFKRLHPALSFHKLWAFWTTLVSVAAALIFVLRLA